MIRQDKYFQENKTLQKGQRWLFDNKENVAYIIKVLNVEPNTLLIIKKIYDLNNDGDCEEGFLIRASSLNRRKYKEYYWLYLENQDQP
jgi:hypothetical protein